MPLSQPSHRLAISRAGTSRAAVFSLALIGAGLGSATPAEAQRLPEIRVSAQNRMPACTTPERLQTFLIARNEKLDPRFASIAQFYKQHGETTRVRWDYAFFQMILETNALKFRRGDGEPGDVRARQNNFAGLGATGGGVAGESFRDVSTGVLAHLQHLVAYSGEEVVKPAAQRTAEVQGDVIAKSRGLGRPVSFSDLTNRWAMDRGYARKIDAIAEEFRDTICNKAPLVTEVPTIEPESPRKPTRRAATARLGASPSDTEPVTPDLEPQTSPTATGTLRPKSDLPARAVLGAPPPAVALPSAPLPIDATKLAKAPVAPNAAPAGVAPCSVLTASFGGTLTLLIKTIAADKITYTALGVVEGQEQAMAQAYIAKHAQGGAIVGQFMSREAAIGQAYQKCDSGRH